MASMRLLRTETVFYALAGAVILHALIYKGEVSESNVAVASAIAALGRAMPTERVDRALDIPLGKSPEMGDRPPE